LGYTILHNTIDTLLKASGIEPEENNQVLISFLFAFLIGVIRLITATVALSLFLNNFKAADLSIALILSGLIIPVFGFAFIRLDHYSFKLRTIGTLSILAVLNLMFFFAFKTSDNNQIIYLYLLLFYLEEALLNSIVWSVLNKLFNIRQAKRLFGILGSADSIATSILGLVIAPVVLIIGTINLIIITISVFIITIFLLLYMFIQFKSNLNSNTIVTSKNTDSSNKYKNIIDFFKNKYLFLIFSLGALWIFTMYFIDIIYFTNIQKVFSNDQLSAFIALFSSVTGIITILFQVVLYNKIMKSGGMKIALIVPAALTLFFIVGFGISLFTHPLVLLIPVIFIISAKFIEVFLNDFLTTPAYYTLFHPMPSFIQEKAINITETIFLPFITAVAGCIIYILIDYFKLPPEILVVPLSFLLLLWIFIGNKTAINYVETLKKALYRPGFLSDNFHIDLDNSLEYLRKGIKSEKTGLILSSLELLKRVKNINYLDEIIGLLNNSDNTIRLIIYKEIEQKVDSTYIDLLYEKIKTETDSQVIGAIILAISSIQKDNAINILLEYNTSNDSIISSSCVLALIKYCSVTNNQIGLQKLGELINSNDDAHKIAAIRILGALKLQGFQQKLLELLNDSNKSIRILTIQSINNYLDEKIAQALIYSLNDYRTKPVAISIILSNFTYFSPLLEITLMQNISEKLNIRIIEIYKKVKNNHSFSLLYSILTTENLTIRNELLKALNELQIESNYYYKPDEYLEKYVYNSILQLYKIINYEEHCNSVDILYKSLNREAKLLKTILFGFISLYFKSPTISMLYENYFTGSYYDTSVLLEILDSTLPLKYKKIIIPIFECNNNNDLIVTLNKELQIPSANSYTIENLIHENNDVSSWIKSIAEIQMYENDAVRQHINKVELLNNLSILHHIDSVDLIELADKLHIKTYNAGNEIWSKNHIVNIVCIVIDGTVCIEEQEKDTVYLLENEYYGELSILTNEIKPIHITAKTTSTLCYITKEEFDDFIGETPSAARQILIELVKKLRIILNEKGNKHIHHETIIKKIDEIDSEITDEGLSTIEKILILKSTALFQGISDTVISELSELVTELSIKKNKTLFYKGETGNSAYIIVNGLMKVHDNDFTIAQLGEGNIVGEMAIISSEPRTATITALKDSLLIKIEKKDFYGLLNTQNMVVRNSIDILITRINNMS